MEERNKKSTGVVVFLIILITAAAIFAVGVAKKNKKGGMPMGFGGARFVPSATSVKTVIAQNSVLHDYVVTNGEIETQKSIEVFPSMGGKVVEMKVSLGSPVKTGDVISIASFIINQNQEKSTDLQTNLQATSQNQNLNI